MAQPGPNVAPALPRALFVDSDLQWLGALRRMLASTSQWWEARFATSVAEALAALAATPFSVVITDARLSDGSGADLLAAARERHPAVLRAVMAGRSEAAAVLRASGLAHQYLPKPCDEPALRAVLARSGAIGELLASEQLRQLLSGMHSLPIMTGSHARLLEEIRSSEPSMKAVGDIIAGDLGMTTKILQLVNSAFFGLPRRVASPGEAVRLLGLETVKALFLATSMFTFFDQHRSGLLPLNAVRNHSVNVASLARTVTRTEVEDKRAGDLALIAGLLHDIGKLLLATELYREYAAILQVAEREQVPLVEAERRVIGSSHAELGAYMLGLWGFPDNVLHAVAFHHNPQKSLTAEVGVLTAVHIANIVEHETYPMNRIAVPPHYDSEYLAAVGVEERLPELRQAARGAAE